MKASDHRHKLEKRRTQTYGGDRDVIDAVLYLLRYQEAQEDDVEAQLKASLSKGDDE